MPRIRDLGISVIPATMRPPEIGPGGGFDVGAPVAADAMYLSCTDNTCIMLSACVESSNVPCDNSCTGSSGMEEECDPPTNVGGGCPGPTCVNSSPGQSTPREASGLGADTIAQLKRHLQERIGTQLQN